MCRIVVMSPFETENVHLSLWDEAEEVGVDAVEQKCSDIVLKPSPSLAGAENVSQSSSRHRKRGAYYS